MKKFTFILECDGGTYVDQAAGLDHLEAAARWVDKIFETKPIPNINDIVVDTFRTALEELAPTPLTGLTGVWYFEFDVRNVHAWGHIVECCQ